jgi:RimJ/RimL family protein N-acetyltransferase
VTPRLNEHGQPIGPALSDWTAPPHPPATILQGRYCRLEPIDPDRHAPDLFTAGQLDREGRNWTYLSDGPFETFAEYRAWMDRTCLGSDPQFYAIVDQASGKAAGLGGYLRITPAHGVIEIGHLNFSPLLQGTRLATEAIYLWIAHAFELGYRRCEWKCDSLNAPSRKAALRFGFRFEGIFEQAVIYKGRSRDTAWFAITDKCWPALRDAFQQFLAPENFDADGRQRLRLSDLTAAIMASDVGHR